MEYFLECVMKNEELRENEIDQEAFTSPDLPLINVHGSLDNCHDISIFMRLIRNNGHFLSPHH